ncbi:putative glycosyltransferase EpsJ [bacterium BMS3Abin03]|nr:putative glycosyltransferase EpsJ [bacterium BMS3Abin03]
MITVICPTYNEEENIEYVLKFFVESPPREKELLIVDGGSTDKTREIVKEWQRKNDNIRLISNPDKYVPFALNLGIKSSNGDPIIRLDAHTRYEKKYFEKIIETFKKTGADIVGGPMNAVGKTDFQKAVAYATSTVFGVGDSKIHQAEYEGESDHVYLGAWHRKLFADIGYFDERLKRNQDDELHYRARSRGKKIYLNPEIKSSYYPRESFKSLIAQYFQYGLYKPIVLKKIKSETKLRHFIPTLYTIYIIGLPISILFLKYSTLLVVYVLFDFYFSFKLKKSFKSKLDCLLIYPAIHLSYGLGFLIGLFKPNR